MPVPDLHGPDELKALVEEALERLDLWPELHGQATSVRYALEVGGKRVRPVIALAVGEALGAPVEQVMPAALAIELVHTFSLVHDDLPALDDDDERRGRPSAHVAHGEGVALLAGYVAELARDHAERRPCELPREARIPDADQAPWRAFGEELGLLFQVVDDLLDGDGVVERMGADAARVLADEAAGSARDRLTAVPADTSVLLELVDGLAIRTS